MLKRKWFAEELCDSCAVLKQAPLVIIGHVMLNVLPNPLSCFAIRFCLRLICSVIVIVQKTLLLLSNCVTQLNLDGNEYGELGITIAVKYCCL